MMNGRVTLLGSALLVLVARHLDAQAPVVVLVGGTAINPGPAAGRSVSTILIEGGRITQVGSETHVKVPSSTERRQVSLSYVRDVYVTDL